MVSVARMMKGIVPRDEHVARGRDEETSSLHEPYVYDLFWKSGTGRTRRDKITATNRIALFGKMIERHAEMEKDFFVWNISRAMRFQAKARDY